MKDNCLAKQRTPGYVGLPTVSSDSYDSQNRHDCSDQPASLKLQNT